MIGDQHTLTRGYVLRHIPPSSKLGVDIAILDIAQDFLLAHLHDRGIFDMVVFKGGTALRKLFAGAQGRFSTDIDLAAVEPEVDRWTLATLIATEADVTLGPFTFTPKETRDRWAIHVTSALGRPAISMKLDVGPPCWLTPEHRSFVSTATQRQYGFPAPDLPCMRLEEILAEKIARLSRKATARDASDLVWAATTSPYSQFEPALVRRLAMLKIWVDNNGMRPGWSAALACGPFDATAWLTSRTEWDDEQIGLLASPPPSLPVLEADLHRHYRWLHDLTPDERRWARADSRDRGEVIAAIQQLPGGTLATAHLY
jgi:predicted nucleotidyltransferase component of viral defense system